MEFNDSGIVNAGDVTGSEDMGMLFISNKLKASYVLIPNDVLYPITVHGTNCVVPYVSSKTEACEIRSFA
jgi:hypothetical protein